MKDQISALVEQLSTMERLDGNAGAEQRLQDLKANWEKADAVVRTAIAEIKEIDDDVPTTSPALNQLHEGFEDLEKCCREWKEFTKSLLSR